MKPFKILSWKPSRRSSLEQDIYGGTVGDVFTVAGRVRVYSFPGNERNRAFTSFETYYRGQSHCARVPRHYRPSWLVRLADRFASQIVHADD